MSSLPFTFSEPCTLGIELELQVVNPPGYDLSQSASTLIAAAAGCLNVGEIKHDLTESMLELTTGVCHNLNQAVTQLSALQQAVLTAAQQHHLQLCGGGAHPFHAWQRQDLSNNAHFRDLQNTYGYLVQQATVFGQHVHVGCSSGENAIYLLHGLSRYVPHCIALSASSPWLQDTDTQFDSSRLTLFSAFPDSGHAPWAASWSEFEGLFRRLCSTHMLSSLRDMHWDIRPRPDLGSVEIRVMDTPLTLHHAVNIAGFIQSLACWLLAERPFKYQERDYLLYNFNRFQACRYGLQGTLTDVHSGKQNTLSEDIARLLDRIQPYGDKLHAGWALDEIYAWNKQGDNEAQRMRKTLAAGDSLTDLVRQHCELWASPL